jgi:hypothetical protein
VVFDLKTDKKFCTRQILEQIRVQWDNIQIYRKLVVELEKFYAVLTLNTIHL